MKKITKRGKGSRQLVPRLRGSVRETEEEGRKRGITKGGRILKQGRPRVNRSDLIMIPS